MDPTLLFAVLVRSDFISEMVLALVVANRSFLETRWSITSRLLVSAAARLSRYLSSLSTVPEGIITSLAGSAVGAAVPVT